MRACGALSAPRPSAPLLRVNDRLGDSPTSGRAAGVDRGTAPFHDEVHRCRRAPRLIVRKEGLPLRLARIAGR